MTKKTNKLNICLMFGGRSTEHDISIISGLQVYQALNKDKYNVNVIYITKDNHMLVGPNLHKLKAYQENSFLKHTKEVTITNIDGKTYIKEKKKEHLVDVFVPIFHGQGVEDGTISSLLDFVDATYITSDPTSSAISQDKVYTKDILKKYHVSSPRYVLFKKTEDVDELIKVIGQKLIYPIIIKPTRLGSSIGIEVAKDEEEVSQKLRNVFRYSSSIIVEELIKEKKEYNCACFKYNNRLYLSNIEEVLTNNDILTFDDKYLKDIKLEQNKQRIIPAQIDAELEQKIKETTKDIYQILNHQGIIRIDYIYDINKKRLFFNEVNTIPGSLAFYLFDKNKLPFDIIIDMLIKEAILNKQKEKKLIKSFSSNVLNSKSKILKK